LYPVLCDGHFAEPRDACHRAAPGAVRFRGTPGASGIPLTVGAITFVITIIAAAAAWSARETETYRVHLNDLGNPKAMPVDKLEYDRMREQTMTGARVAKASA
jgi:hypothetical protein